MEALNAVGLTPISVFSEKRTKPRKIFSLPSTFPLKFPISANLNTNPPNFPESLSKGFPRGLVFLSAILNTGLARALTYEEALKQLVASGGNSDFDPSGFLDSVINFGVDNPVVAVGGATTAVVVPLALSQILSKFKPFGVESAKSAFAKLGDDVNSQLLDIREKVDLRQVGSPDIRGLKKKPLSIVYKEQDKTGFLKKLGLKFKEPENTTLFILDKFDGNSKQVAELVTANGFKAAYAIKDGAEGPRGWMNSGLPWLLPKKTLSLDFGDLADAIGGALGEDSDALPVALGFAAASGLGLLAFSEVETVLQILGSAALVQFIGKKLLFAEDRKQTLQQIDEFLSTKVAPKELADEIKEIGKAILPSSVTSKSLPATTEASPADTDITVEKAEAAAADPTPQINSAPKTEVEAESLPRISRPLSPYPYYPDYKPPTSPRPSQP